MSDILLVIAGVVLVALGLRYAVGQMQRAAREYRAEVAREEIREIKAFLETLKQERDHVDSQD